MIEEYGSELISDKIHRQNWIKRELGEIEDGNGPIEKFEIYEQNIMSYIGG